MMDGHCPSWGASFIVVVVQIAATFMDEENVGKAGHKRKPCLFCCMQAFRLRRALCQAFDAPRIAKGSEEPGKLFTFLQRDQEKREHSGLIM